MKIPTKEWAEREAATFNGRITINEDIKRPHILNNFQIEEFEDGFVIWCDGPFVVRGSGEARLQSMHRGHGAQ